jgi:formylglycine-generating enzyme required for sulfatase activity
VDVWLDFVRRHGSGDEAAFAELCARRPELAAELGRLRASPEVLAPDLGSEAFGQLLRGLSAQVPLDRRLRRMGLIARGGMGDVHRVEDPRLGRTLALKEMAAGPAERHSLAAARFYEEAQITAQLDHPGIVPVHECGIDAEGRLYFAMKLVRGRDLREILELARAGREGWTLARLLGVLAKVCEAMAYAHAKGVVHRDLKPGNIMVGHFGEVYVMDWGLARALGRPELHDLRPRSRNESGDLRTLRGAEREESSDSPLLTMDGIVLGTPAYMPPEQARGEPLSPRSDVYSLGAVLYQVLVGAMPYAEPGARVSQQALLERVIAGAPLPVRALRHDAPAELAAICEKAMARDPARRYADMSALHEDLRAYLEGRVVQAHERGPLAELRKWVGRNKGLTAASLAALLVLLGGLVTSASLYVRAAERTSEVLRLSALEDLDDLEAEADLLWPADPGQIEELEAWLARARALLRELPAHERQLAVLRERPATANRWWLTQLEGLVSRLRALEDERVGLIAGLSPEHGWGVQRRLEFARSVEERTLVGTEAAELWRAARASIRDRGECPEYGGLELEPQLGLLPIGRDPFSGLWEFAHLQSGEPAVRGPDGRLLLQAETGLVLVLIPGGTVRLGAQNDDSAKENYQPGGSNPSWVYPMTLTPFFLSKYEMTQAQWTRFAGKNPSDNTEGFLALLRPVELVEWLECASLVTRMGLALPTDAQWERAARAGTSTTWWTGMEAESLDGAANLFDRSGYALDGRVSSERDDWLDDRAPRTNVVGSYDPNPFGLHDVYGNVAEWCDTQAHYVGPAPDVGYAIHRGGGWQDRAAYSSSATRGVAPVWMVSWDLGLRPARPVR